VNNEELDKTQGVAATFAHELASPLGALGYSLEMLRTQIGTSICANGMEFFEQGLRAPLVPPSSEISQIKDRSARRLAQAILRAPLMETMTEGLLGEDLEAALKSFELGYSLKCAQRASDSSLKILANLRHWGNWKDFFVEGVSLQETLMMAWAMVAHRCKNLKVSWKLDSNPVLRANPHGLAQVWGNLMLNAAQTSTEEVLLTVTLHTDGDRIIILFENNGPELPKDLNIFERGQTNKKEGSGLGLYLCREIIGRHGGTIDGKNIPGGVCFDVILPTKVEI
jgi:signal transduction histidine kinase